ncbi:Hyaluronan-binding protein 2 [Liparis tanakae]|uniref:trypsin n=1 Tax=Liparis tanakae TaxID=230148 RepID=A0A4Z2HSB8_9TELE|nr:Hyaluronan-binding protein 2 [Liparis tanakae]
MQVVLGGVDLEKEEVFDQVIPVEKAIVHEKYKETPSALYNDVALLQLKVVDRPLCAKETRFVKSACLPSQAFSSGTECVVSGWGVTETEKFGTDRLLDARVLLISQEKCRAPHVYGNALDDSMFCAGNLRGGRNGTHYVVGVVSWGDGCGKKYKPGVYANVGRFVDWIARHLGSRKLKINKAKSSQQPGADAHAFTREERSTERQFRNVEDSTVLWRAADEEEEEVVVLDFFSMDLNEDEFAMASSVVTPSASPSSAARRASSALWDPGGVQPTPLVQFRSDL